MVVGTRFNPLGARGLDCPACFREDVLHGALVSGCRIECPKCWAQFRFEPGTAEQLATLERIPLPVRESKRCDCGAHVGAFFSDQCQPCIAGAAAQQRLAAQVYR